MASACVFSGASPVPPCVYVCVDFCCGVNIYCIGVHKENEKKKKFARNIYKYMVAFNIAALLHKRRRALGVEHGTEALVHERYFSHLWEAQFSPVHLDGVGSTAVRVLHYRGLNNLNGARLRAVTTGHLRVQLLHSPIDGHVTILLVHVVGIGSTLISEPHAIVEHLQRALVMYFVQREDFPTTLLGLLQLLHKVPEFGPS